MVLLTTSRNVKHSFVIGLSRNWQHLIVVFTVVISVAVAGGNKKHILFGIVAICC